MRVVTVLGARPQFVKASATSRIFAARGVEELIVHTGQHYDPGLSQVFFDELGLPEPWRHLDVGSATAPVQTGRMLERLEDPLRAAAPDVVVVVGDTNSTLAGALAAAQLGHPVAHIEAGLRSFRRDMPEERNRVLTDHLADVCYAPSRQAVAWLAAEGVTDSVVLAGDVMRDVLHWGADRIQAEDLHRWHLAEGTFVLATVHRPRNTDDPARLRRIVKALGEVAEKGYPVVLPLHPRTRANVSDTHTDVRLLGPLPHSQLLTLACHAHAIVTDSGGLQKEAYWLGVPCITLRAETEWVETVAEGWNRLVDDEPDAIVEAVVAARPGTEPREAYGGPGAAERIVTDLMERFG